MTPTITSRARLRGLRAPGAALALALGAAAALVPGHGVLSCRPRELRGRDDRWQSDAAGLGIRLRDLLSVLTVTATGAAGATNWIAPGGAGAAVTATVPVTAGASLVVTVAAGGGAPGGGGSSDLRTGADMTTALLVGAGGGAGGYAGGGGRGGDAGVLTAGSSCADGAAGMDASTPPSRGGSGTRGAGATCSSGGAAGVSNATAGQLGTGGAAGTNGNGGGGGGAGYYGGGGGGAWAGSGASNGGGGGGGASYLAEWATFVSASANPTTSASLMITYDVPIASIALSPAAITVTSPRARDVRRRRSGQRRKPAR